MKKADFFDYRRLYKTASLISIYLTTVTAIVTFLPTCETFEIVLFACIIPLFIITFFVLWVVDSFCLRKISFKVGLTKVEIVLGDILTYKDEFKVIATNEYFDTDIKDDRVISTKTLYGKLISKNEITSKMVKDEITKENLTPLNTGIKRRQYKLGSMIRINKYLIFAFTKFSDQNEAYLTANQYIDCLMEMWKGISKFYGGYSVNVPVLGTGITRFTPFKPEPIDNLDSIINTFRFSHIDIKMGVLRIVISKELLKDISMYSLKKRYGGRK